MRPTGLFQQCSGADQFCAMRGVCIADTMSLVAKVDARRMEDISIQGVFDAKSLNNYFFVLG